MLCIPKGPSNRWGVLLLVLVCLGWLPAWGAEPLKSMRVVMVFDNSGSMRKSDPQRLSWTAAQLFLDLARPQDVAGLIAFSDSATPLVPLTSLTAPAVKDLLRSQLQSIKFTGQTTDLASALAAGLASFPHSKSEGQRDLVLLFTDGKLDLGPHRRAAEPAVLARIRQQLLPEYRQRDIALYTIAFTEEADQVLLQEMAQATRGEFRFIKSAAALHKAFLQLFILAQQAEEVPFEQGTFLLDQSIGDVSLVLPKHEPQEKVSLRTPQQTRLSASNTPPGVTWTSTPAYDLVHLTEPEPGVWSVEQPSGVQAGAAVVGSSTLNLDVEVYPAYREVGEPVSIRASLRDKEERLRDAQQLQQFTFRAEGTSAQGETVALPLVPQSDGIFAATLPPLSTPGQYKLVVTASSPTLRRQQTVPFTVYPACFQVAMTQNPPVTLQVTLANECPSFRTLTLEAERTTSDRQTQRMPLALQQPGVFAATIPALEPGQTGQVTLHIRGTLEGADAFTRLKGSWPLPATPPPATPPPATLPPATPPPATPLAPSAPQPLPEAPQEDSGTSVLYTFVVLNGLLLILGGAGYGCYRFYIQPRKAAHE